MEEFFMKRSRSFLGIIALAAIMFSLAGCATMGSIGGTADPQGLISSANVLSLGRTEIAQYSVYLGLLTSGYERYAEAVEAAIADGKHITTVTTWYVFFTTTRAYTK